ASGARLGQGLVGFVDACGNQSVSGWACDRGSDDGLNVELEVDEGSGNISRTYYRANHEREPGVARRCGTHGSAHGFEFRPPEFAPGSHPARVVAYDGSGRASRRLASCELV